MVRQWMRFFLVLLLVAVLTSYALHRRFYAEFYVDYLSALSCKESFSYARLLRPELVSHSLELRRETNRNSSTTSLAGRNFSASEAATLKKLHLTCDYGVKKSVESSPLQSRPLCYVIVTVSDQNFYENTRAVIASIQQRFSAENFTYRIVLYDLDGEISANGKRMSEIKSVCHLELRVFNFTDWLPKELHHRRSFAWKPLVVADVFKDLDANNEMLIYADSSISFTSIEELPKFFEMMGETNGNLTPVQLGGWSRTSTSFATHLAMYDYLPGDPEILAGTMWEANILLLRKTEESRRVLKWAVLCARTRQCIDPEGSELACPMEGPNGVCHRQDQSVFNILVGNMEAEWQTQQEHGARGEFISRMLPGKKVGQHPLNDGKPRFEVNRGQTNADAVITNCAMNTVG